MRCSLSKLQSCTVTTIESWITHLPFLHGAIRKSEFVSIDLELTGLHTRKERFVGVERCYEAHKEGANSFVPLQIGICPARRSETSSNKWILTPSSIYIFPKDERIFQVSAETLCFLRENHFDFNKWISSGVGYIKPKEENERKWMIQRRLEELRKIKAGSRKPSNEFITNESTPTAQISQILPLNFLTSQDELFLGKIRENIRRWIVEEQQETVDLFVESAFHRLLAHSMIVKEFPSIYGLSTRKDNDRYLTLFKSRDGFYDQQLKDLDLELTKIDALAGVRKLLDEISVGKKILVGHNCFYDFVHLYHSFYDSLPANVSAFKAKWTSLFPYTLDTKNLAESHGLLSSLQTPATLKGLCDSMASIVWDKERLRSGEPLTFEIECLPDTVWSLPESIVCFINGNNEEKRNSHFNFRSTHFVKHEYADKQHYGENFNFSSSLYKSKGCLKDSLHEAGFDSMMTSITFILQCSHILQEKNFHWKDIYFRNPKRLDSPIEDQKSILDLLSLMLNRIRLVKTQPNVINLNGQDDADMSRHLFMYDFPKSWKRWEILKVWAPLHITISSVDDSSCWLVARNDEDLNTMKKIYNSLQQPPLFKLQSYREYVDSIT